MEQPLRWATVHSSCECPGWLLSRWIFPTRETSSLSLGCLACFGVLCTYDKYVEIIRSLLQSALWSSCFLPVQKSDRAPRLGKFKQSISEKALQPIIFEMNERYQFFTFFFFFAYFLWIGRSRHCSDVTAYGLNQSTFIHSDAQQLLHVQKQKWKLHIFLKGKKKGSVRWTGEVQAQHPGAKWMS